MDTVLRFIFKIVVGKHGDYNDLLSHNEKIGKRGHQSWLLSGFWEATLASGLIDLGMHGYFYTWEESKGNIGLDSGEA